MSRKGFQRWFVAATIYNAVWGSWTVLFPEAYFRMIDMSLPSKPLWQCVGMMVLVYALGYMLVARQPERYAAFAAIGLVGKIFGPLGFAFGVLTGELPLRFGWFIPFNDLIWWPVFAMFCFKYCRRPFDSCAAALEQSDDYRP
jgi:small multidrug resistance pump